MASAKKPAPKKTAPKKGADTKSTAKKDTAARASRRAPTGSGDLQAQQARDTQVLAAAFDHNPTKAAEYGRENALDPPEGVHAAPTPLAGASTLSEAQASAKTGTTATAGSNPAGGPLDRVRVDSGERALTTNQGVPIAQNQDSLKAGLRGPALLKDFILRE